ncbi:Testis-specific serine/threonine-protein kinase 1 [Sarcoptes scabiei]|uniref:Testis-specific serine/threonine-protein kinase 1 n=1 Tax=Sarcoptes scabiei TaxID=52283 RepID=A0A131ZUI3_SARSC|nr:Testis-specific serine/threonine-protein kinase 1 [Sarcoptes scabiei]KPM02448.1 testis-specific serine/threonine-protein kinase 1-like protein 1 [Sarcoptes scabiei]UXI20922.1 hypothetical protein NH340_JMT06865 [Sarcoptes scabiei]
MQVKCNLPANEIELLKKRGFKIGHPLNSGSFALVCKATYQEQPIAVKVIDLEQTSNDYRLKFLPREIYTIKKLKHKYLIEMFDILVIGNKVLIFMELAEGGDLLDLLNERKNLSEDQARFYYLQFGDALKYMHSLGFAHRDIKCENILLNKTKTVAKLTDFGFSRTCFEKISGRRMYSETHCGSVAYVAPEILQSHRYNPLISDVWSIGVVLYVLVNNRLPFVEKDSRKMVKKQLDCVYRINQSLSSQLNDLIGLHLNPNPSNRINMDEVFHHQWFDSLRQESV